MRKINYYLIGIIFVSSFIGCSNKQTEYLKDGEALLYTKNVGNEKIYLSIELFKKELKIHPNSTRAQTDLAVAYGNLGQHDYAIQLITNSIGQRQKDLAGFYHLRGMQKFIKSDLGNAIEDFRTAIQLDSSKQNIYRDIVFSKISQKYYKDGKWQKFEKKDVETIIKNVYPKGSKLPSVKDF